MPPISIDVKELALGPSGRVVYLLQSGGIVSAATIDQHTGLFSHLRSVAHVPPFAFGMAISSQQKVLQITDEHTTGHNNWIAGPVFEFRLMPNGDLTPATPPTFPATYPFVQSYRRLAPDPSNGFVVVTR